MSYNVKFDIVDTEDGPKIVVDEEGSYVKTAPLGRYTVTGHQVLETEARGYETIGVNILGGLSANAGRQVTNDV